MDGRIRIGVIFGGRSVEHEVSLISARSVIEHLDPERYEVVPIGITRQGKWFTSADANRLLKEGLGADDQEPCILPADPVTGGLIRLVGGSLLGSVRRLDVIFPLVHGGSGEDGTLQGLLELANIPYVGAGVMASAIGMDKDVMKRLFREAKLPVVRYRTVLRRDWLGKRRGILADLPGDLGYPCFVKPANTGSSVGITKIRDPGELEHGLDRAFRYDRKVVVEAAVDAREIECSVLGNDEPIASVPGEIIPCHEFYDYAAKYLEEGSRLVIPAPIPPPAAENIQKLAVAAFKTLDGAGMARVDFFLERKSGRILLNELNTIPGFTPISMYPKLWEASGMSYGQLLDRLITLALERHREKEHSDTDYRPDDRAHDP